MRRQMSRAVKPESLDLLNKVIGELHVTKSSESGEFIRKFRNKLQVTALLKRGVYLYSRSREKYT